MRKEKRTKLPTSNLGSGEFKRVVALLSVAFLCGCHVIFVANGAIKDLATEVLAFVFLAISLFCVFKIGRYSESRLIRLVGISLLLLGLGWPLALAITSVLPRLEQHADGSEGLALGVVFPGGPEIATGFLCLLIDNLLEKN